MIGEHTDRQYAAELRELRNRLLLMTGRVEQMIAGSVEAVVNQDTDLAKRTIEMDRWVNRDEIETDELCLLILAKWQPMATDLRFITLALKMVTDLERMADHHCTNLAEQVIFLVRGEDVRHLGKLGKQ
jgi:phosphate transport system protein